MTKLLPLLALALLLAACGPARAPEPATVAVDPAFSPDAVKVILDAAQAWQDATHGQTALNVSIGTEADIYIHPGTINGVALGVTDNNGNDDYMAITIDVGLIEEVTPGSGHSEADWLANTAQHELGHAFGLDHEPDTLMQPAGYGGATIDAKTLAQFHRING